MAGVKPFFITGARCKIKVNGVTLAFATDLDMRVDVPHAEFNICGSYEVDAIEPVGYHVSGSFTIIRYVEGQVKRASDGEAPKDTSNYGNGVGSFTPNLSAGKAILAAVAPLGDGRANESLDPAKLQEASGFDIEVYIKAPKPESRTILGRLVPRAQNLLSRVFTGESIDDYLGVMRVRGARITSTAMTVTRRGVLMQRFEFKGMYLDDDSFIAGGSRSF